LTPRKFSSTRTTPSEIIGNFSTPSEIFRDFLDTLGNSRQQVVPLQKLWGISRPPQKFSGIFLTPRKFSSTGSAPSEIFVLQHPSEIFNLAPPQKFRISDPFGKSRQQGGVDIKWNGPLFLHPRRHYRIDWMMIYYKCQSTFVTCLEVSY
jgi:hypothetical protein